ncbi:MAG: DUF4860 domain-containing protein [Butyrivibrio sp.]|nr:DUF4860 domain-containing protein [Butyrivibrio sp.]
MNIEKKHHIIDTLFVILLLFMFAFCVVTLISLGASVYQRNVDTMSDNFNDRTTFAYISEKIRQSDTNGGISMGDFENIPAIVLEQEINQVSYTTYLYQYEGFLCELMKKTSVEGISPAGGQQIIEINDLKIEQLNKKILKISVTGINDEVTTFYVSSHSQKGRDSE